MENEIRSLVISTIKYGESALICRCYTETFGLKSFLLKNRSSKGTFFKKKSFFIPLSQVFITPFFQKSTSLITIKEIRNAYFYKSLHTNASKIALAIFLSEFLNIVLKEGELDSHMFTYLINSFKFLDQKENNFADFYLLFMIKLTKFLGFYPNSDKIDKLYFDLQNGIFTSERYNLKTCLSQEKTSLLRDLITRDFLKKSTKIVLKRYQRRSLLNIILNYYHLHQEDFHPPKSMEVLLEIF